MQFVVTDELKTGMRLAKPIYNKNGVLLYDINSKLTIPAINSINNFGLIGIYILEPAEPVPPLSKEDIAFEQLQTVFIFKLRDVMDKIVSRQKITELSGLIDDIVRSYGRLDHRVNFNQNLRSPEDFVYKHAISTAILVAMITSRLSFSIQKQRTMIAAALLYGVGYRYVPRQVLEKGEDLDEVDRESIRNSLEKGLDFLSNYRGDFDFFPRALALMQVFVDGDGGELNHLKPDEDLVQMRTLMRVADQFDRSTAMNIGHYPVSEIEAIRVLDKNPTLYHPVYVSTLCECIHICPDAASVDFTDGTKGIVLVENPIDYMHPVVLRFSDNQIYDLTKPAHQKKIQIKDIMKTMDNRVKMDKETIKQFVPDKRLQELTRIFRQALRENEKYSGKATVGNLVSHLS